MNFSRFVYTLSKLSRHRTFTVLYASRQPVTTRRSLLNNAAKFLRILKAPIYSITSGLTAICLIPPVKAAFGSTTMADPQTAVTPQDVAAVLKHADQLYSQNDVAGLYEYLLKNRDDTNAEVTWRLARATCDMAKSSTDKAVRQKLMYEAQQYATTALAIGPDNFACHKWYAIMLDYVGEYEGTKERISKAYNIKEHFMKAIELNPKDATSIHLLGYWCFVFADLPWYQKKLASVIFATPPSSSYDEALKYFRMAEDVDPGFYSTNLLMIGKTSLRMKDTDSAKQFLIKARDYPVRTEDDKKAHAEAIELLTGLGVPTAT